MIDFFYPSSGLSPSSATYLQLDEQRLPQRIRQSGKRAK
jgi:hypothetical protein